MYCCLCDLQQRHHPTPSCEGCVCFFMGCVCFFMGDVMVNPFKRLADGLNNASETIGKYIKLAEIRERKMKEQGLL